MYPQRKFDEGGLTRNPALVDTLPAKIETLIHIVAELPPQCSVAIGFLTAEVGLDSFAFLSISYDPRAGFHLEAIRGPEDTPLLTAEQVRNFLASASEQAPRGGPQAVYGAHPDGAAWPVVAVERLQEDTFAVLLCIPADTSDPAALLTAYSKKKGA